MIPGMKVDKEVKLGMGRVWVRHALPWPQTMSK